MIERVHTVIISCYHSNPTLSHTHTLTYAWVHTLCTTEQASITTLNKVCVGRYDAFEIISESIINIHTCNTDTQRSKLYRQNVQTK